MLLRKCIYSLLTILLLSSLTAQDLPPIGNYPPTDYQAGNQNWMISQDQQSSICVANNEGLLIFNGADWDFYPSPNQSIMRSVRAIGDRIYSGCYMEFGYWQKDLRGVYQYQSLSQQLGDQIITDEQFWNIAELDHYILFQSLSRVYVYDTLQQTFSFLDSPKGVTKLIQLDQEVWLQYPEQGLFRVVDGDAQLVSDDTRISNARLANIFSWGAGHLIVTQSEGFYYLEAGQLRPWIGIDTQEYLKGSTIFCGRQLANGDLALGTVSQGLMVLDTSGRLKFQVDQTEGLNSNNILNLFEDQEGNLWLGLFNGINCINLQTPFKSFYDNRGVLGTVYAAAVFQGQLYLGTNQGLFSKPLDSELDFSIVEEVPGQVWSLTIIDDLLFCGHDAGTSLINNRRAELISREAGTWKIIPVPGREDLLIQGHYQGFSVLQKTAGRWRFSHAIDNYDAFGRFFEITDELKIYTSHVFDGLFEVQLDEDLQGAVTVQQLDYLPADAFPGLAKVGPNIYYTTEAGVFALSPGQSRFEKDQRLSQLATEHGFFSGHMNVDRFNQLWLFYRDKLAHIRPEESGELSIQTFPVETRQFQLMRGYENVTALDANHYLVGATVGYTVIGIDDFATWQQQYPLYINGLSVHRLGEPEIRLPLQAEAPLHYQQNSLQFTFNVPTYDAFQAVVYQYRLVGAMSNWSDWSESSVASFEKLRFGEYRFEVRARIGSQRSEVASYSFSIGRPWYWSHLAIATYFLLALILGFAIHSLYRRYYHNQQRKLIEENRKKLELERLKSEQTITQLRNAQLQRDIESKSKELAASTMSLIKKNEQLIEIREMLEEVVKGKQSSSKRELITTNAAATGPSRTGVQKVIKAINANLTNEESWNLFKEAFDNADQGFLHKVQELHPQLSPSELKLCAYLRLNISSKEIASLLNISVRSVEIKRYRLRKKLGLVKGENLVNYILKL